MSDGSRSALERCVGDSDSFLAGVWGLRSLHHRSPGGFGDLLKFEDVDHMLSSMGLRFPLFRLVKEGQIIPTQRYTKSGRIGSEPITGMADPARIFQLFEDGATIVLQGMHRFWAPLQGFCRDLEMELGHPTQVNAYITPPGSQGFDVHEDAHDVFVLQAFGRKRWEVYEIKRDGEVRSSDSAPALTVTLEPGDALYIPEGAPHAARTEDEASGHLTVGVHTYQWKDVLGEILRVAEREETFLERLPAGFHRDSVNFAALADAKLDELARWIEKFDPSEAARTMIRKFLTSRPSLMAGSLQGLLDVDDLTDDSVLRRRPQSICHLDVDGGRLFAFLSDRELQMPASLMAPMQLVAEGSDFRVKDLSPWLDADSRLVLARRLIREGVLEAAPSLGI